MALAPKPPLSASWGKRKGDSVATGTSKSPSGLMHLLTSSGQSCGWCSVQTKEADVETLSFPIFFFLLYTIPVKLPASTEVIFLLPDIPLLENKNYKKMLNFRGIQENMDEHSETFLSWAAAVLFMLFFEGSSRMCSWNTEDEVSLQAPSLSLGAEGQISSSGEVLKGSIHMSIKSLSWKW